MTDGAWATWATLAGSAGSPGPTLPILPDVRGSIPVPPALRMLVAGVCLAATALVRGQEPRAADDGLEALIAEQARQVERLERQVAEMDDLRAEMADLRARLDAGPLDSGEAYVPAPQAPDCTTASCTGCGACGGGAAGLPSCLAGSSLVGSYNYNFGGGYITLATRDGDFSFNIQNQMTADGTFYDLVNANTLEKGFNIPFYRLYFFGNFLEDWEYLASVQQSLGSFNILDMYVGYKFADELNIRVGHFLSPFLYEYYAFSPAWEPVITNSPLFQFAGKRQTGGMLWGRLFDNVVQYQVGAFNGADGAYFDVDAHIDAIAGITWTPFKPDRDPLFEGLGCGFSIQNGVQDYVLSAGTQYNFPFGNGEPTLNQNFVNSTGLPFFTYVPTIAANGNRFKIAPQLFWFGQFSVLAEYVRWNRALTDGTTDITETVDAFYVNTSYFLTGERYTGDGLLGYTTIEPRDESLGAWEIVAQFSQIQLGQSSLTPGFATQRQDATRLQQIMGGVNWWPNRYVRVSLDYVADWTNRAVEVGAGEVADSYGIWWGRVAAFF